MSFPIPSLESASSASDVLQMVRRARAATGLTCPHCHSRKLVLWGTFRGRQRYRCGRCRRTWSDLTSTALAYSKRIDRWPAYVRLFHSAVSVRRAAAVVGLHPCTAFRWRHAILDHIRRWPEEPLSGLVQLGEMAFAVSHKGSRRLPPGDARRRSARVVGALPVGFPRTRAVLLVSATGEVRSGHMNVHLANTIAVARVLTGNVAPRSIVVCRFMRGSAYGTGVRSAGCRLHTVRGAPGETPELADVDSCMHRFRSWMHRFRGVATRYLSNYLRWHRLVGDVCAAGRRASYLMLLGRAPP